MKLSEKIRILRKARGMSQEEFGYSLSEATEGVTRQTVSDWENGKFEPKLDNIRDIARVLSVSFDVLLDETIDLNDAETLKSVLHHVSLDTKKSINTKIRYDICQYKLGKKDYVKLAIYITILAAFVISLILFSAGLLLSVVPMSLVGMILGGISLVLTPVSIIGITSFVRNYKNPQGAAFGEINNTHLIIHTYQTASNVICIPLEKIKDIRLGENATKQHGDLVIVLDGREKPITLLNVAFPHKVIEFYEQLQKLDESDDPVKII